MGYVADNVQAMTLGSVTLGSVIECAARSIGSRLVRFYLYNCPNRSTRAYEDTCEQRLGRVKLQRRKLRMGMVGLDAASRPILRALDACHNRQSEYGLCLRRLSARSSNPAKRAGRLISNSDRIVRYFGFNLRCRRAWH